MKKQVIAAMLVAAFSAGSASATTISGSVNVDNVFSLYLSTSDSVLGNLVLNGNDWTQTRSFSSSLTSGVTNYLHLVAINQGGPGGFLGSFTLGDSGFKFNNGTQTLLTGDAGWRQNGTGFGNAYAATVNEGGNGVSPWGNQATYGSSNPQWVWYYVSNNSGDTSTRFFSAQINAVPEPGSLALLGLGLLGLGAMRKRRA